jgi:predicted Zn-dependent protease
MTGDVSGAMAYGLESARILAELRYSRKDEEEADREGLRMLLTAGVDPSGMIAFFEMLKTKQGKGATLPQYLSTHPATEERIARLRSLAPAAPSVTTRLLSGHDWRAVRNICQMNAPIVP